MNPLISVTELDAMLNQPGLCLFDVSHDLFQPDSGLAQFAAGHIPGARHLHIDRDLSASVIPGRTGRHPLPVVAELQQCLRRHGVNADSLVVVYDRGPGLFAARLWWLLRWLGHAQVRLLDGGVAAWQAAGLPLSSETPRPCDAGNFEASPQPGWLIDAEEISQRLDDPFLQLLDARNQARFDGLMEPIDPVAGHIPGAACLPCDGNLGSDGRLLAAEQLRQRFEPWLRPGVELACYCGSGLTACHNILAAELAGLPLPRLYAGSWSEWICDPQRPRASQAEAVAD